MLKSMLKASLVSSAVFAVAWFRMPPSTMVLRYFIFYGILIAILSVIVGLPIAALMERLRIGRWWSYLTFAASTGALLGALSSHPTLGSCARPVGNGEQETCIENPFAITFSPWTRSQPGFAENPSIQWSDYKVEPKKSLRMSAPLAEPVAFKKREHAWQMTPRTTSQPTNLFRVMIEPICTWPALEVIATGFEMT